MVIIWEIGIGAKKSKMKTHEEKVMNSNGLIRTLPFFSCVIFLFRYGKFGVYLCCTVGVTLVSCELWMGIIVQDESTSRLMTGVPCGNEGPAD